jgi:hypothetical protein
MVPQRPMRHEPWEELGGLGAASGLLGRVKQDAAHSQQGFGGKSTQLGDLVVRHALALEPQGFHPLLHTRMRMMVAFVVQGLFVCFTECKLENPGIILFVRRSMLRPHHR